LDGTVLLLPPPMPHPAAARVSNSPAASGTRADFHRFTEVRFRCVTTHIVAIRNRASISTAFGLVDRGGAWGRGLERGALREAAVVDTATPMVVAELPTVTAFGVIVQVASEGAPVQAKFTAPENPPSPLTLSI